MTIFEFIRGGDTTIIISLISLSLSIFVIIDNYRKDRRVERKQDNIFLYDILKKADENIKFGIWIDSKYYPMIYRSFCLKEESFYNRYKGELNKDDKLMTYDEFQARPFKEFGYETITNQPMGNIELVNVGEDFIKNYHDGCKVEVIFDLKKQREGEVAAYRTSTYTMIIQKEMKRVILFTHPDDAFNFKPVEHST